eukprot:57595_1
MSAEFAPFPSRCELKWSGCSLICAQALWVLLGVIYAIIDTEDYDASIYEAHTEEDVLKLHKVLSSDDIRSSVEISAALYWLSFPFYLVAIHGLKKLYLSTYIGTKMEMWVYVLEKSYLFSLLMTNVIGPAISLTIVSFEWSIHEYTPDTTDFVPTGYYIQLYSLIMAEELYDAVCIADGAFLFLLFVIPLYRYFAKNPKFNAMKKRGPIYTFDVMKNCCYLVVTVTLALSIAVAYLVSLFRFANSGFFSLNGGASWIPIYGIILKFFIGFRLVHMGYGPHYEELKQVFGGKQENLDNDEYNMDPIRKENENV